MREFREREETLKNTMITTHKLAEDIKESSRKEASLIVKDAELKYQQMLERAREEKVRLESDLLELRRKKHHFVQDLKKMLHMHLEMVGFEEGNGERKAEPQAAPQ
jgi:cell division initiation protein